jgi:hypothetical protein
MTLFSGLQLRPNGKMPLSAHEAAGGLLKEVYAATTHKRRIYRLIDAARCMLEDWAATEYPDGEALPNDAFFHLYYHLRPLTFQRRISTEERARHIASLREVQEIVVTHYPDSAPLQELLKKLDDAIEALEAWVCKPPFKATADYGSKNTLGHPPKSSHLVVSVDAGGGTGGGRYRTYLLGTTGWMRTLWAGGSDIGPVTDRKLYCRVAWDQGDPETYRSYSPDEVAEHLLAKVWEDEIGEVCFGERVIVTEPGLLDQQDIQRIERRVFDR